MKTKAESASDWTAPFLAAALWIPVMIAASYEWSHGKYYDYGWFVPPAAVWFLIRRWNTLGEPASLPWRKIVLAAVALLPWLLVLRVLGHADPSWCLPMGLLAVTAALTSHGLIALAHNWRTSAAFLWITLLALSAVPWPSIVEQQIVMNLTDGMIHTVSEWFQISGRPVEVEGARMRLHDITVEVTDGCSGVRSFQSFVMATWFFAELQQMRWARTIILLASTCVAAFVMNSIRIWALAKIRFDAGVEAFDSAHGWIGVIAFLASATFFYFFSGWLSERKPRRLKRKTAN